MHDYFTTKNTKDTKGSRDSFVLFVSFVVNFLFDGSALTRWLYET